MALTGDNNVLRTLSEKLKGFLISVSSQLDKFSNRFNSEQLLKAIILFRIENIPGEMNRNLRR